MQLPVAQPSHPPKAKGVHYLSMSLRKLYLLTFVTAGFYQVYWFYRNWKAIKLATGRSISPFWRAIFSIFFVWPLFKEILKSAKEHGYKHSYRAGWLATAYIVLMLLSNAVALDPEYQLVTGLVGLGLIFLIALPLFPAQKAINYNNQFTLAPKPPKNGYWGQPVMIVVGVILFILAITGYFIPADSIESPAAADKRHQVEALTAEYEACSDDLVEREAVLDTTDGAAVDAYNADWEDCEDVRLRQHAAVDEYHELLNK